MKNPHITAIFFLKAKPPITSQVVERPPPFVKLALSIYTNTDPRKPKIKIHLINGTTSCRKVQAVISHLNLAVEPIWLDFFEGDNMDQDYRSLNPAGHVPTLVDGDFILWESNAINIYLCQQVKGQTLYPDDLRIQADINRWLCWELAHYNRSLSIISFEAVAKPSFNLGEPNQGLIEHFTKVFDRYAPVLNQHLSGRDFVVGNDWTIADYALGQAEMFQEAMPIEWSKYPNLVRYYQQLRHNPHWVASAPISHQEMGKCPSALKSTAAI